MSESASVWVTKAENDIDSLILAMKEIKEALASGTPQASAVSAERVVELERHVAKLTEQLAQESAAIAELDERNRELSVQLETQAEDKNRAQASAVSAERVVELERQLAAARDEKTAAYETARELERQLASSQDMHADALRERDAGRDEIARLGGQLDGAILDRDQRTGELQELHNLLATAYVAREVPWSDVAAGMMTIARDGTAWMVLDRGENDEADLANGDRVFTKTPADGETVRVLVPYVTPEQAEALVRSELGGRA